jgi:hypothetical protein
MNRRNGTAARLRLATSCLAGLLAALLVVVVIGSGAHRGHSDQPGHHDCAACLLAHGGLLADGATGASVSQSTSSFDLPSLTEARPASVLDLRLAPGRAPPA